MLSINKWNSTITHHKHEKILHLASLDCSADVRESLALKYFIDVIRDPEFQQELRFTYVKDVDSALLYSLKHGVTQQTTWEGFLGSTILYGQNIGHESAELKKRILSTARELRQWK